jgi:cell division protein FtsL
MLNTINGFDLVLVIIIVIAGFKIYNLNRECESYVRQIIEVSQDNYRLSEQIHDLKYPGPPECLYCLGIEEFVTGNECYCESF